MGGLQLRFIPIGALLGDDESAESLVLPTVLGSDGSRDLTIDKYARATSIGGYTKRNAAAVTTNTGGVATRLRSIHHYTRQVAGQVLRQELGIFDDGVNHWELRFSIDAGQTWTFLADYGVGSPNRIPSWTSLGNQLILVNGYIAVQGYNGAAVSDASSVQLGAPTIVDAGAGNLLGAFRWKVVVRKADGTRKAASKWSARTSLNGRKATITWTVDADAASYEVYRTTGTGEVALFAGSISSGTLSFTDNVADLDLISGRMLQEYGDAPVLGIYHVFVHKSRVFYLRTDANPRLAYYSDPGLPFSVHSDSSFIDMTDAESFSDVATGGTGGFNNMAVIWLERSVWTISGTGNPSGIVIAFERVRSNARVGTVHVNTVARVSAGALFIDSRQQLQSLDRNVLAYLTPFGDLRAFDGNNDIIISFGKGATFKRLNYAQRQKAFVIVDTPRNEYTWVFPADDSVEPNIGVTWNTLYGTMTERAWPFACGCEIEKDESSSVLLAGEALTAIGGFCYQLWDGRTRPDGSGVPTRVITKTLYGLGGGTLRNGMADKELLQYDKRWRWVDLLIKATENLSLLVEWLPGETAADEPPHGYRVISMPPSPLTTSDGSTIKDADGKQVYVANTQAPPRVKLENARGRHLHSRGMRLRISQALYSAILTLLAPMASWRLGERTGVTAYDDRSQLADLTLVGGCTLGVAGALGDGNTAITLDGLTGYLQRVGYDPLNTLTAVTLLIWVNHQGVAWAAGTETAMQQGAAADRLAIVNGVLSGRLTISGVVTNVTAGAVSVNGWHLLGITWATGAVVATYLDGVPASASPAVVAGSLDSAANLLVGAAAGPVSFFNGTIDEPAIFQRALSAAEMATLYAAGPEVPRGWSLAGLTIAYQLLTGLKRTFHR